MHKRTIGPITVLSVLLLTAPACKKKVAVAPPSPPAPAVKEAPPPPPTAPVIAQFTAEPGAIQRGQSTTLRWSVTDATKASIDPATGTVQPSGTRQAYPSVSTTYTLTARGPGGTATAMATVNVTVPPPPPHPTTPTAPKTLSERLSFEVRDAYFDFDKSHIREDARATLSKNAEAQKALFTEFSAVPIVIEGHCDERGSAEYNLALGDRRAHASKEFLVEFGVPAGRLNPISYGKERPQCTESDEDCRQKNRRVHFVPGQ